MKKILVVILTTSDSKRDIIDGYHLQAPGYVKKPVDMEDFKDIYGHNDAWQIGHGVAS